MARRSSKAVSKSVETLIHEKATRRNIPTVEHQSLMRKEEQSPIRVAYERRNRDLDPQLVWRGKDEQDWSDLVVHAPPLYIQEKVHPKALIDDLASRSRADERANEEQIDLFADFNGLPDDNARTEFYQHDANWSNRMILGDSLQVMAALAEREGLRGQVQCIYLDPPYGIKFNSNFQWSTTSRDVKDGKAEHITREPEQVKAFRDTWRDGIHSYLTYLRDRLAVARDLLADSGSIFVQIGDENVHRVRAVMDEIFAESNFVSVISFKTSIGLGSETIDNTTNYIVWYSKSHTMKYRSLYQELIPGGQGATRYRTGRLPDLRITKFSGDDLLERKVLGGIRLFRDQGLTSRSASRTTLFPVFFQGATYLPSSGGWRTSEVGIQRTIMADRVLKTGNNISFRKYFDDFRVLRIDNFWSDVSGGITSRSDPKIYVVQTSTRIIERCLLMTTDPGDLVLDPTCGSGTTAYVAEQWGRRWITIDTSRVALALARARVMGARYPYYLLADSPEGQAKEAELTRSARSTQRTHGDVRHGFVYERVPHITLKSIANNTEIDVIYDAFQEKLEPLRRKLNKAAQKNWEEWEIPRQTDASWPAEAKSAHGQWWEQRIARQQEIDASIAARADFEYLYDKPYQDKRVVRVAGPFTVESLSPHRVLGVDENDELIEGVAEGRASYRSVADFASVILENLRTAGVQQAHKEDRIAFTSLTPWPGDLVCAQGRYIEGGPDGQVDSSGQEKRAAVFIGPEFGTVSRPDLVAAAREAGDADFDVLIACAFNYDAHSSEFDKLGRIPVLKARMNADLHMADDLKNTGKGNLFVIFGEPDIDILEAGDGANVKSELAAESIDWKEGNRILVDYDRESSGYYLATVSRAGKVNLRLEYDDGVEESIHRRSKYILGRAKKGTRTNANVLMPRQAKRVLEDPGARHQIQVKVNGVDVFHPQTGEIRSDGPDGIACWFIDTDYNEESFFVRHAYFLGANDPYKALKNTLKAEINEDAWATLHSDTSRPFAKPKSGRIAVKVINHLGDEVMKVFKV